MERRTLSLVAVVLVLSIAVPVQASSQAVDADAFSGVGEDVVVDLDPAMDEEECQNGDCQRITPDHPIFCDCYLCPDDGTPLIVCFC